MTSKFTREELLNIINTDHVQCGEASALARMALAAMDSESGCLHLDYLQGHKDGLEWAAKLAEANHPDTGDWLYDDPIELAKAIRKGPDMPPVQPVADSEPVIVVGDDGGDALSYRRLIQSFEPGTKLYRNPQPAPVVPDGYVMVPVKPTREILDEFDSIIDYGAEDSEDAWRRLLAAAPQSPGSESATVPGKWIPVSERMPEEGGRYWCYVEEQNSLGKSHYQWNCSWNGDVWSDKELTGRVTHWMPLPAAPQEVKSES
ncbi:DUF551 domain-containing protein [Klebsiella pneumoniae]|uniref:DUF551 domain-containing protein n=1 Tax=Klebsiella pneumoniae TaxID=573 RepID=UPI000E23435F|nr:DUF551 domain-containing protein [Klebsiella pneumoniae]NBD70894.1 DUF551 domain-containing protein [Klebsiella pneumoniae]RDY56138.1 DUF551 domain-containing protein [Klebsiella pneumoniae]